MKDRRENMKCILLCAGYATRLFPLTKNFPKALLEIEEGKPLLNYIVEEVNTIPEVDGIALITNERYAPHFTKWAEELHNEKNITVYNDHTTSNEDRLGAIGDIHYVINKAGIDDDVLIIAGDNLFTYPLKKVIEYYHTKNAPVVCATEIDDVNILRGFAVAELNEKDQIMNLIEKPHTPPTNIAVYATYVYPKEILDQIRLYLEEGNNPDAPGYFVEYLYKKMPVYAYRFEGECYDVGTHEALDQVRKIYQKKLK